MFPLHHSEILVMKASEGMAWVGHEVEKGPYIYSRGMEIELEWIHEQAKERMSNLVDWWMVVFFFGRVLQWVRFVLLH